MQNINIYYLKKNDKRSRYESAAATFQAISRLTNNKSKK